MTSSSETFPWCVATLMLLASVAGAACDSSSKTFVAPAGSRCAVAATSTTTSFPAGGGSGTVQISTARECAWTVRSDAAWVAFESDAGGQGDGSVRFSIGGNPDPGARAAALSVSEVRMQISQDGRPCEFRLSSTHETVGASGGEPAITVEASHQRCTWSAASQVPWINIASGASRTGSGEVRLDVAATTVTRSATVLVAGQIVAIEQAVAIEQVGCAARPSITSVNVTHGGGRVEVPVIAGAGCPWSVSSNLSWISVVSSLPGAGTGVAVLDAAANPGSSRSGTILVAGQSVTVQQASSCSGMPAITAASVSSTGGAVDVPVVAAAGCQWSAQSESPWISITSGSSGTGAGSILLTAAPTDGPSRQGSVNVSGVRVVVTQLSGCRYSVQPVSYTAAPAGASGSIAVQTAAGCPWTADKSASWVSLGRISGEGPAAIPVVVAPNHRPPRTATITFGGVVVDVLQASLCTWSLAPPAVDYQADGGPGAILVIVTGGCTWTATSDVGWVTVLTGHSGTGNGLVQIAVAANAGPSRSGLLRIAGMDLVVRQSGR